VVLAINRDVMCDFYFHCQQWKGAVSSLILTASFGNNWQKKTSKWLVCIATGFSPSRVCLWLT
jgi:hypothetical protein